MKKILCLFFTSLICVSLHANNITWSSTPTILSAAAVNASEPQVAIDANGNAVAAWIQNNLVKASTQPVNGNWTSSVSLSASGASAVRLVSDLNGNATAIWIENGVVKAATKPFGSSWSSSTALSTGTATSPSLCVDTVGDVIAAWVKGSNVETSTKLFGANWQTRTIISSSGATTPCIAIGGSGANRRAVLVWGGVSNGNNVIFTSTKLISSSWSSGQVISDTLHGGAKPFVAVDSNANALAIWYAYDIVGSNYANLIVTSAARPSSSGIWSEGTNLSTPGIRNPSTLAARIAFDSIGNAIAMWDTSYDDETFTLESAVKPVNGNWGSPVKVVNSNLYAYDIDLASTSFGDVLGLYMFYNGSSLMIQSIESDINGFSNNLWSVPITISSGANNAYSNIAATITGNTIHAVAVWVRFDGVNTKIAASTGVKTLVLPPTDLSVSQNVNNFGAFNEYYNTLSWTASTDPNVVGYLIFRNGLFAGQVAADALQFIDNNRVQNGSVTYGVTAIDSLQTQSRTVSVNFP